MSSIFIPLAIIGWLIVAFVTTMLTVVTFDAIVHPHPPLLGEKPLPLGGKVMWALMFGLCWYLTVMPVLSVLGVRWP